MPPAPLSSDQNAPRRVSPTRKVPVGIPLEPIVPGCDLHGLPFRPEVLCAGGDPTSLMLKLISRRWPNGYSDVLPDAEGALQAETLRPYRWRRP